MPSLNPDLAKYFNRLPHPRDDADSPYAAALAAIPRRGLEKIVSDVACALVSRRERKSKHRATRAVAKLDYRESLRDVELALLRCGVLAWEEDEDGAHLSLGSGVI